MSLAIFISTCTGTDAGPVHHSSLSALDSQLARLRWPIMTGPISTPRYSHDDFETASIRSAAPSYGEFRKPLYTRASHGGPIIRRDHRASRQLTPSTSLRSSIIPLNRPVLRLGAAVCPSRGGPGSGRCACPELVFHSSASDHRPPAHPSAGSSERRRPPQLPHPHLVCEQRARGPPLPQRRRASHHRWPLPERRPGRQALQRRQHRRPHA